MAETPQDAESFLLQQRKEQLEAVRAQFARHGQQVHDQIVKAVRQKNGLSLMLQRLGLHVPRTQEEQLEALAVYLSEHGNRYFLRLMNVAVPKPGPVKDASPQATPQAAQSPPPQEARPLFDARGNYIGPERRSGVERRAGGDRRNFVEAINRNKRFGGDRRKLIRRQSDRAAAAALGLRPQEYPPVKP